MSPTFRKLVCVFLGGAACPCVPLLTYKIAIIDVLKAIIFKLHSLWDITACRSVNSSRRFEWNCRLHFQGLRSPGRVAVRTLYVQRANSSEMSIAIKWSTQPYIPEDMNFAFVRTAAVYRVCTGVFTICYILDYTIIYRIRYSVVIVVNEQRAGQLRIRCPIAERWKRFFLFSKRPDWLWDQLKTPTQKLNGLLASSGVKRPGHETDHSHQCNSESQSKCSYNSTSPYA